VVYKIYFVIIYHKFFVKSLVILKMGFFISSYPLHGIQLQNVYVSIKGRYSIQNSSFAYGMSKRYQIYADYWFSVGKNQPTVQCNSIMINTDDLPAHEPVYSMIYENIKKNIDPQYSTPEQTLTFTDD